MNQFWYLRLFSKYFERNNMKQHFINNSPWSFCYKAWNILIAFEFYLPIKYYYLKFIILLKNNIGFTGPYYL